MLYSTEESQSCFGMLSIHKFIKVLEKYIENKCCLIGVLKKNVKKI